MKTLCLGQGDRWDSDPPYHPDERRELCLSPELVEELFAELQSQAEQIMPTDLLSLIQERERLRREAAGGTLPLEEEEILSKALYDRYVKTCKRWPHQEPFYNEFYRRLNNGNWS